ncbi:glycosyltransferase family 4 protein [Amorphus sp. 3PC139-8]|uniref:glycosyltransferase family 4 protein n=1 Tax=Amorphus sp. 3PC139-8 TaxID=2735676 RepID=UPI00345D880E
MRVIATANAAWNIWNFRRPVIKALLGDAHEVLVLAPPDDSVPDLEALGCRFAPLEMKVKGLNPLEDLKLIQSFKRFLRTEKPDVVLSYTIKNNVYGSLAARATGTPFIPNVTGLGTAFLSSGLLQQIAEALYRRAFDRLPVVFFQNADDRDLFLNRNLVREDQARLLPGSGIDLAHFAVAPYPENDAAPIFLMIGRLLRDKGVLEYVEAARRIKSQVPTARFQILGAIGSENRTAIAHEIVESWQKDGTIEYLGTTSDVRPYIAAAHCVVLPSYREGAPRTLIEAASMARPLVTTDVPGCRTVVDHCRTGFLCDVKSNESLTAALFEFLNLPNPAKKKMGLAGRTKMETEFDEAVVIDAYQAAITEAARQA